MADVLICYKSERRNAAEHLARVIELYGYSVWFDYWLFSGEDFGREIERELEAAKAVVVLWCPLARESEQVIEEALYARSHGKLVPAWLERTEAPLNFQRTDIIDLTMWNGSSRGYGLDRLLDEIARLVEREPQLRFNQAREYDATLRGTGWSSLAQFPLIEPLLEQDKQKSLESAVKRESHLGEEEKPAVKEPGSPRLEDDLKAAVKEKAPKPEDERGDVKQINVVSDHEEQNTLPASTLVSDPATPTTGDEPPLKTRKANLIALPLLGIALAGIAAGAAVLWRENRQIPPREPVKTVQTPAPAPKQVDAPPAPAPPTPTQPEPAQPEPAQPEPAPPEPAQPEPATPEPATPKSEIPPISSPGAASSVEAPTSEPLSTPTIEPPENAVAKSEPAPETDCDRLAADPEDPDRISTVEGMRSSNINENQAAAACSRAINIYPAERRFTYQLGRIHYSARRYGEAVDYLTKAAAAGSARANHVLGSIYEDGKVGGKDYAKAERFYLQAARAGHAYAMRQLGELYEVGGSGVAKNYPEAAKWYRLAADAGNASAMYELGAMYENDWGVGKDIDQALRYYRMGADRGDAKARAALARLGNVKKK